MPNNTYKRVRDTKTGQKRLVRVDRIDKDRHEDLGEPEVDVLGNEVKSSGAKKASATSGGEPATKPNEGGSK